MKLAMIRYSFEIWNGSNRSTHTWP